jgi:hypothetical protein
MNINLNHREHREHGDFKKKNLKLFLLCGLRTLSGFKKN